jgi:hypothetical protein
LLDLLAAEFMDGGWSIKRMHRLIMLSATYQQQSMDRPECRAVDPENTLLWKANRQRLDFESTRDALIAASGRLDRTIGGPSFADIGSPAATRRTVYGFIDRLNLPGLFRTFDFPNPDATSPQRDSTTVPQQALFMMNHPLVLQSAQHLLERPELAGVTDVPTRVRMLYLLTYGREPLENELVVAQEFLGSAPQSLAWQQYAQGLLLANEFVFID